MLHYDRTRSPVRSMQATERLSCQPGEVKATAETLLRKDTFVGEAPKGMISYIEERYLVGEILRERYRCSPIVYTGARPLIPLEDMNALTERVPFSPNSAQCGRYILETPTVEIRPFFCSEETASCFTRDV